MEVMTAAAGDENFGAVTKQTTKRSAKRYFKLDSNLEAVARIVAGHFARKSPGYTYDDCLQAGRMGAWKAQTQFTPGRGYSVEQLAQRFAKQEIITQVRRNSNLIHVPLISKEELKAEEQKAPENRRVLKVDCSEWKPEYEGYATEYGYGYVENKIIIDGFISKLPAEQRPLIRLICEDDMGVKEASEELGITHDLARYRRRRATDKMHKLFADAGLKPSDLLA